MRSAAFTRYLRLAICAFAVVLLEGCNYLTVSVHLDETGGGTRTIEAKLESELSESTSPTYEQAIQLLGITRENGWKRRSDPVRDDTKGNSRPVFEHASRLKNADDWKRASGDLSIRGTLESGLTAQPLYTNTIEYSLEPAADRKTFTYRERFSWISFLEYYTDYESGRLWQALSARYPALQRDDEIEIRGLVGGLIAMTTDLQTGDEKCDDADDALDRTLANRLLYIIRRRSPSVSLEELSRFLEQTLDDSNDQFEKKIQQDMPGAYLATKTEIVVNITFPGRIVDSNAHKIDGQIASWTIHPIDAIARPQEIFIIAELIE